MNTQTRNIAVAGGAVLLGLLALVNRGQSPVYQEDAWSSSVAPLPSPTTPAPATTPTPVETSVDSSRSEMHIYAVDISWLQGFPPDASPGDVLDIWVAWDRSVVKGPNMQLLLEGVVLEKIAPPVTPQGPYVAFLIMTRQQSRLFLSGRKYGALNVTRPAA